MSDPAARSALDGHAFGEHPGATLAEAPIRSLVQVAAWPGTGDALDAALRDLGLPTLPAPCRAARAGDAVAFDAGPGTALLLDGPADIADALAEAVAPEVGTVTDLSHARVRLRLSGPRASWCLAKLVALDLHPSAFPVDGCAQTRLDRIGLTLHRAGPEDWTLLVPRAFARSAVEALETACRADVPA